MAALCEGGNEPAGSLKAISCNAYAISTAARWCANRLFYKANIVYSSCKYDPVHSIAWLMCILNRGLHRTFSLERQVVHSIIR
ncbi:hypothetical protein ANN_15950 [Periplaneta americana]|uniref:Uncharacterized protein n=1 Tax=Periplaneta americana TaxID=6978 RepID=A0ABQ8SIN2_PERAM|nr:hypothetical protein ANN_15950 [Periplaneta americana]